MSGGLAPSKTTVYVGNLPFSLTNNDLHKVFEKYGRVVKITIMKDKEKRHSRGVAFVLFLDRESAQNCVHSVNNTQLFGRTIKCSIAKDNGRASEFIRRKIYKDKSHCYECGEEGHLSYNCPKNLLGDREVEKKKKKKRTKGDAEDNTDEDEEEHADINQDESLAAAISYQQTMASQHYTSALQNTKKCETQLKKRYKKDDYFSDEEELGD